MEAKKKGTATLSRRGFVAAGTAALGAVSAGLLSTERWLAQAEPQEAGEGVEAGERIARTFHLKHCGGPCSLKCTVRDGRLALIEPNTWPDYHYQTVCVKGLSEIQHVYSMERLQRPMKRVGERGSGEFVEISWDEAIDAVVEGIKRCQETYGCESVQVDASEEANFPLLASVLKAQANPDVHGIDMGGANGFDPAFGALAWAKSTNELSDWPNSKTIILFGTNHLESSLPDVRWLFEAKEAGAYIVVVDPAFTTTAAKADEWIPITPGTDAAMLLGMASVILDEGWYDAAFLRNSTSMPFLVDVETGEVLRDTTAAPLPQEPAADGSEPPAVYPPLVWDEATGSARPFNTKGVRPALSASCTVAGRKAKSQFALLKKHQETYTPEWAEAVCGVPAQTIRALAERYATGGPASLGYGQGGLDKYANADVGGHTVALLGALTGSIGKKGSGVGYYGKHRTANHASFASWPLPEGCAPTPATNNPMEFPGGATPVKAYINIGDCLHMRYGDFEKTKEWIDTLDFIVTIDPYHVTSVDYSDIVLPVCSRFELDGDYGYVAAARNHVMLQEKVLDPLFESKTDFEVERLICSRFVDEGSLPATLEEYTAYQLDAVEDEAMEGISVQSLLDNGSILPLNVPSDPVLRFSSQVFDTLSTKMELYYEDMLGFGQALPTYEEPMEAGAEGELAAKYPLQFSQPRTKFYVHCQFCDATWIKQYHEPTVELNPVDAECRGIADGDMVEVYNDRGSFSCVCRTNESVRPGTARAFEGMWEKYMESGCIQSVTNAQITERGMAMPYGPVIPFNDTRVEVRRA